MTDPTVYLTEAEIRLVKARCGFDEIEGPEYLRDHAQREVTRVTQAVKSFTESNLSTWMVRVLEHLLDPHQTFRYPKMSTRDDLWVAFTKARAQAITEDQQWFDDDPEDFKAYHKHRPIGPKGPEDHPWGDMTVAICSRWIQYATPFEVWGLYQACMDAASGVTYDIILDMAMCADDGSSIAKVVERTFAKGVKDIETRLTNEIIAEHATKQSGEMREASWRGFPMGGPE